LSPSVFPSVGSNANAEVYRDTFTEDVEKCVEQYLEGVSEEVKRVMDNSSGGPNDSESDTSSPSTTKPSSGFETTDSTSSTNDHGLAASKSTRDFAELSLIEHLPDGTAPLDFQPNEAADEKPHAARSTGTFPRASPRVESTWKHLEIIHTAAELIAKAEQIDSDPVKLQLIEDYIRLTNVIVLNETAIKDAVAHVQIVKIADEEEEAKNLAEIEAALAAVNKVRLQRDAALAIVADHEWGENEAKLAHVLHESVGVEVPGAESHELLVLMYAELKRQGKELLLLRTRLESSLSSLNASDDAQILALQQRTTELSAKLNVVSRMEMQCQTLIIALLRSREAMCTALSSKTTKVFVDGISS